MIAAMWLLLLVFGAGQVCSQTHNSRDVTRFTDCHQLRSAGGYIKNGTYHIFPGNSSLPVQVLCVHGRAGSGTLIQSRYTGTVPFERVWADYKRGFGSVQTDYWLGLDHISALTSAGNTELTITMQDWTGVTQTMIYKYFNVLPETQQYRLSIANAFGYLPDDMSHQNGMPFATLDRPDANKCAHNMRAGWWYNYCAFALLNGHFYHGGPYHPSGGFYDGIYWRDWHGFDYSLKYVSMAVSRP